MSIIVNKPHIQGSMKEIGNSLKYLILVFYFVTGSFLIIRNFNGLFSDRSVEKEHLDDYIAKKREMFLVQVFDVF